VLQRVCMYACMHVCNMPCRDCNAFCNIPYPFYWSHRTHDPYIPSICITSSDYLVYKQHRRTAYTIFKISLPQRTNQTGNLSLLLTPSSVRVAIIAMELQQMRPVSIVGLNVSVDNTDGYTKRKMLLWRAYVSANSKTRTELNEIFPLFC
jgi:hypothetical protein